MIRRIGLPIAIIIVGFGLAAALLKTGPSITPQAPVAKPPLVRALTVQPADFEFEATARGTVMPRSEADLIAEVSGRVVELSQSLVTGGFFKEDDVLLRIDPLDYEIALEQASAQVQRAVSELATARKNYERQRNLSKRQSTSESLEDDARNRLQIAEAAQREAKARLAIAERDLERTVVRAPYDGRVRTEQVDLGQFLNRGSRLAKLYAIDAAEVRLPIKDDELAFLNISLRDGSAWQKRPSVSLSAEFAGAVHRWSGEIVRTEGELDPKTRMIQLVASVADPYREGTTPLPVGLFVDAVITGGVQPNIVRLPRVAMVSPREVYIVDSSDRLVRRTVTVLRSQGDFVYINDGLIAGDRVCLSRLATAMPGMKVRVENSEEVS